MTEINEIIAKFKEITKTKCIGINTTESKTGPFESSFGGTPYFPKDFEYPYAENFNQRGTQIPMMLLAQINFEEVPHFENFPEKGILQIFINPTDDLYGADFDNPTVQKNYKIFYHADIDKNLENQQKAPIIKDYIDESKGDEIDSPIDTPLKLSFEIQEQYMTCSDYKFDEIFTKLYNEETGSDYEEFLICQTKSLIKCSMKLKKMVIEWADIRSLLRATQENMTRNLVNTAPYCCRLILKSMTESL